MIGAEGTQMRRKIPSAGRRVAAAFGLLLCATPASIGSAEAAGQASPQAGRLPGGMIADPENGCATSNPLPRAGETIRWRGGCRDGLLSGPGILLWLQDGRVREQNEGLFIDGELDGQATTTFVDGSMVVGNYVRGVRHGEFVIRRANGDNIRAIFADGRLISERRLNDSDLRNFRDRDQAAVTMPVVAAPAAAPAVAPQAYAPQAYAPQAYAPQAYAPQAYTPQAYAPQAQPAPVYAAAPVYATAPVMTDSMQIARASISPWSPNAYQANAQQSPVYQQAVYQQAAYPQAVYQPVSYPAPPPQPVPQYAPPAAYQYQPAPWQPAAYAYRGPPQVYASAVPQPFEMPSYYPQTASYDPRVAIVQAPQPSATSTVTAAHGRVMALGGPEQAIGDAMMLERAGRNEEAAQLYGDIALVAGSSPAGQLAAQRAATLRAPNTRLAVNPAGIVPLPGLTPLAYGERRPTMAGKFVCSARGLFANNANWCGRVLREEGNDVEVEVRNIRLNRLFAVGFSAAPCTGGRFLSIFGQGSRIWVSRGCLEGNP